MEERKDLLTEAVAKSLAGEPDLVVVPLVPLSNEESRRLLDHQLLFQLLVRNAFRFQIRAESPGLAFWGLSNAMSPFWQEVERFDQTLGPGLSFLADRTGADAVVMSFAELRTPRVSTFLGWVDLRTGDLLWVAEGSACSFGEFSFDGDRESVARLVEQYTKRQER